MLWVLTVNQKQKDSKMKIIGYTYEAGAHCAACAQKRHTAQPFPSAGINRKDEHGLPENGQDNEGNPIHPIFDTDEQIFPLHCGDCHAVISAVFRPGKTTLESLDAFTRGYITAAFWTFDENAPSGEYSTSGRPEILFDKLAPETLERMADECAIFQQVNESDLAAFCPRDEQNGHDFWLARNHHGSGFFDREQTKEAKFREIGQRLTQASHACGERDLYTGDDGKLYIS
jgi:hypothetical protein